MDLPYLIVGLGNPGAEYAGTRHNAGFLAVERVAVSWAADWSMEDRLRSRLAKGVRSERRFLLCEPLTFMNASGEAVRAVSDFYRIAMDRTLVVVDDADLPLGELRMRANGSSGGHHGLESIERHLGSRNYTRLRIGIGRTANDVREISGHVLGKFRREEREVFEKVLDRTGSQIESWLVDGTMTAMNKFNGSVSDPKKNTNTKAATK